MHSLKHEFETFAGKKLHVIINDNRSTMLSVKWEPDYTQVSLHRMFLNAPQNVMDELACYLRRDIPSISKNIKAFIEKNLKNLDYSHTVKTLYQQGNVYNLKKIYDSVNKEYFNNALSLNITWFGRSVQRNRNRVFFGLYQDSLRLIKIHRLLDSPIFPDYIVHYVVYHEMVHHICPGYIDKKGMTQIHSKEFKEKEMQFRHYGLAQKWIRDHQNNFFTDS